MHPNEVRLNDFIDRALPASEQAEVERHLESCAACRGVVDDLREIRRATKALTPIEPPAAVWRRIETAIRQEAPANAATPAPQWLGGFARAGELRWLAAAALLVLATIVGVRLGPLAPGDNVPSSGSANGDAAQTVEWELRQAEEHYDRAIKGLEQIAREGQSALDPGTAATLQKNLAVIDQAISESRAAVRAEPDSEPAQASLLENFTTKIALLQDTVSLINEMRKGNDAGAAEIVSGLK